MYVEKYAGFWKRFVAHVIDQIILGIVHVIFIIPVYVIFFIEFLRPEDWNENADYVMLQYENYGSFPFETVISLAIFIGFVAVIIDWLYYALMETSVKQATVGKMVLNIKVTDLEGRRISFGRASARYFGKILSGMIFMIGYIMAGFTSKKQALHDILADCLVINSFYEKMQTTFPEQENNSGMKTDSPTF